MRRTLSASGTSFQVLLKDVRAQLAKRYLTNPRLSLSEVAFLLGYSEPSAFHRAFRKWTGTTPVEYRESSSIG